MRKTSECNTFPYTDKTTCYILVYNNGKVEQIEAKKNDISTACEEITRNNATLYAVWPGNYTSDLFIVNDLGELKKAFGLAEASHIHDIKWSYHFMDDGITKYAFVNCILKCGCSVDKLGIKQLAADLKEQKNWDVATSQYSGSDDDITIKVRRKCLE